MRFFLSAIVFLLFLSLNSDSFLQAWYKSLALTILGIPFLIYGIFFRRKIREIYYSLFFLILLMVFEFTRFGWAFFFEKVLKAPFAYSFFLQGSLESFLFWGCCGVCFWMSLCCFSEKKAVERFFWVLILSAFFITVSGLPNLMQEKLVLGYSWGDRQTYLPPLFYQIHPWINQYLFVGLSHSNYLGDLISIGLFPALALTFYQFLLFKEKLSLFWANEIFDKEEWIRPLCLSGIYLVLSLTLAAAVFRLFSRGTMLCFFIGLFYFIVMYLLKFHFKVKQIVLTAFLMTLLIGFLFWAGNFQKAWWEILSLENENVETGSLGVNEEGIRRAQQIYQAYPVWGAGHEGYSNLSPKYAIPGKFDTGNARFVNNQSFCHYWQTLAEEGIGAYLYFLFLLAYFLDFFLRIFKARSRFQFVTALSLNAVIVMVLLHAAFGHLMQKFSIPVLICIAMGTSLAILRKDYQNE